MEGMKMPSWEDQKNNPSESFHLDQNKVDPVERLVEDLGTDEAFDELTKRLDENPGDEEARRQVNLLVNRLEDLSSRLRQKVQH